MATKRDLSTPCSSWQDLERFSALVKAHDDLLAALSSKREAISMQEPDPIVICRARWNVSRTSRAHRILVDNILRDLSLKAGPANLPAIDKLRKLGSQQTQRFTRHVQDWTAARIMTHWADFCSDSAEIQAEMQMQIRTERSIIGRMLQNLAVHHW